MYHSWRGTLKNPRCSMALSTEYRSKFEALHRYCWRLHMSKTFLSGTKKNQPNKQTNSHHFPRFSSSPGGVSDRIVDMLSLLSWLFQVSLTVFLSPFLSRVSLDFHDVFPSWTTFFKWFYRYLLIFTRYLQFLSYFKVYRSFKTLCIFLNFILECHDSFPLI